MRRPRVDAVDLLRGLVMVVMTLDHVRDFFGAATMNPRDVTEPAMFVTRWVTHFCAPVFVFLAGTSAFLYGQRGGAGGRFLWTRGLWLIVVEVTVVRWGWTFDLVPRFVPLQVIWALGGSMIVLAALVRLPRAAIGALGLAMILGHNLLDGIRAEALGPLASLWRIVHAPGPLHPALPGVFVGYPLVPWVGVMATGYWFGAVVASAPGERRRITTLLGIGLTVGFVLLRGINGYGDPTPWRVQPTALATLLAFVNCEKYPPSLLFLLMTLGPALLALAACDTPAALRARPLVVIGRVPFFYYVLHLPVIHGAAILAAAAVAANAGALIGGFPPAQKPPGSGFGLPVIYGVWAAIVVLLYPACHWFAAVKERRTDWWLSYL